MSPVFEELAARKAASKALLRQLFWKNTREVLVAAVLPGMPLVPVLLATTPASFVWTLPLFTLVDTGDIVLYGVACSS